MVVFRSAQLGDGTAAPPSYSVEVLAVEDYCIVDDIFHLKTE